MKLYVFEDVLLLFFCNLDVGIFILFLDLLFNVEKIIFLVIEFFFLIEWNFNIKGKELM